MMNLKQWKVLDKAQKLGNGYPYCFVRRGCLYVGGNYGAVRLNDLHELLGLSSEPPMLNARVSVENYPKSSTMDVVVTYGAREDNLRDLDSVFDKTSEEPMRKVDAKYLATICDIAKAFGWYVAVDKCDRAMRGRFVDSKDASHGDFVLMGVLTK